MSRKVIRGIFFKFLHLEIVCVVAGCHTWHAAVVMLGRICWKPAKAVTSKSRCMFKQ